MDFRKQYKDEWNCVQRNRMVDDAILASMNEDNQQVGNVKSKPLHNKNVAAWSGKRLEWNKPAVAIAIFMLVVCGTTVYAAYKKNINAYLDEMGVNDVSEEAIIDADMDERIVTDSDELKIKQVYTDGSKLYFTLQIMEGAKIQINNSSDHAYVNGVNCYFESFEPDRDNPNCFFGIIDMMWTFSKDDTESPEVEGKIGEKLLVTIPLRINDESRLTNFEFSVLLGNEFGHTKKIPDQTIYLEKGLVAQVHDSTVAPSEMIIYMNFYFDEEGEKLSEEEKEIVLKKYTRADYCFADSLGTKTTALGAGQDVIQVRSIDGGENYKIIFTRFNVDTEYIMFIPYTYDEDADDKMIEDTVAIDEEHAFKVMMK